MTPIHRHAVFAGGALATISATTGILTWISPASESWLNRHGFVAWPIATLMLTLFAWSASNWYRTGRELVILKNSDSGPVPEDKLIYEALKDHLPVDSPALQWLRDHVDARTYRLSDIEQLISFDSWWRSSGRHFLNEELERTIGQLAEAISDFISYQGGYAEWAPTRPQDPSDPTYQIFGVNDGNAAMHREIRQGLSSRADKILSLHNQLYAIGSRLRL